MQFRLRVLLPQLETFIFYIFAFPGPAWTAENWSRTWCDVFLAAGKHFIMGIIWCRKGREKVYVFEVEFSSTYVICTADQCISISQPSPSRTRSLYRTAIVIHLCRVQLAIHLCLVQLAIHFCLVQLAIHLCLVHLAIYFCLAQLAIHLCFVH